MLLSIGVLLAIGVLPSSALEGENIRQTWHLQGKPDAWLIDGFLSPDVISDIVKAAPATVRCTENWANKSDVDADPRECGGIEINHRPYLEAIRRELELQFAVNVSDLTHFSLRRTEPGSAAVKAHLEVIDVKDNETPDALIIIYLKNGAPAGLGRIKFPLTGMAIEPKPGTLIFVRARNDQMQPCPLHMHEVEEYPATASGDRLLITLAAKLTSLPTANGLSLPFMTGAQLRMPQVAPATAARKLLFAQGGGSVVVQDEPEESDFLADRHAGNLPRVHAIHTT